MAAVAAFLMSAMPGDGVISKVDGMTVINTTSLATDVEGYMGPTPLLKIKSRCQSVIDERSPKKVPHIFVFATLTSGSAANRK